MEKNKLMMIIIIALLVVLIGVIGVVSFLFMKSVGNKPEAEAEVKEVTQEVVELEQSQITTLSTGEAISTNLLTGTDGVPHIMRVTISIGVNNSIEKDEKSSKFIALMESKQAVIRDVAIGVITNKTYQEVTRPDGRDVLKAEILAKLQEEFNSNLIVEVNLSDYYTQ